MSKVEKKLAQLGIVLGDMAEPKYAYVPCRQTGNLLYLSGQVNWKDGVLTHEGRLGQEVSIEQGQQAARQTIINSLSVLKWYLGDLDRVVKVVKLLGFVNSAPDFVQQPLVMNGASELLIEVFGEDGKHARSAIGTSALPDNAPIEVEIIVEIRD